MKNVTNKNGCGTPAVGEPTRLHRGDGVRSIVPQTSTGITTQGPAALRLTTWPLAHAAERDHLSRGTARSPNFQPSTAMMKNTEIDSPTATSHTQTAAREGHVRSHKLIYGAS